MIGPISGEEKNHSSQEQEIVLIEVQPRPRWPRYTFLLVLVGILGAAACTYYYLRPVSIGEITGSAIYENHCDKPVSTWGIVALTYFEAPGFKEIDGKRRGYWLSERTGSVGRVMVGMNEISTDENWSVEQAIKL